MAGQPDPKAIAAAHGRAVVAVAQLAAQKGSMSEPQRRLVTIAENGLGVLEARVSIDLTNSDTLLSSVLRQIGHDVRTPLMSALGAVEMLDDGDVGLLDDQAQATAVSALAAIEELVGLVNSYLANLAAAEPLGDAANLEGPG